MGLLCSSENLLSFGRLLRILVVPKVGRHCWSCVDSFIFGMALGLPVVASDLRDFSFSFDLIVKDLFVLDFSYHLIEKDPVGSGSSYCFIEKDCFGSFVFSMALLDLLGLSDSVVFTTTLFCGNYLLGFDFGIALLHLLGFGTSGLADLSDSVVFTTAMFCDK